MRIMALDVGEKRVGVAISDKTRVIAQNLMTLNRKNLKDDLKTLKNIVEEKKVHLIVVGLPLNMNGTLGKKAEEILKFKDLIERRIGIDVETYDERLSSKEAEAILIKADISRKKRKGKIDKIAAQIILQNYLNSKE